MPDKGARANLFVRCLAGVIDPLSVLIISGFAIWIFTFMPEVWALFITAALSLGYGLWFLALLRQGLTPGKKMLGLQVINCRTGEKPGFGRMVLRELVGRFVSGIFLGQGFFCAVFDKNSQAWHDRLAGTVVIKS